ncbi:MAG: hypothetical protein ACLFRD_06080 [Nitriliruptoraceae bacterium]
MPSSLPIPEPLIIVLIVVGLIVVGGVRWWRRRRIRESLQQLLARDPSWRRTDSPCGWPPSMLAGRFSPTPRGDRRFGVDHGIEGPLTAELAGAEATCTASCFQWWYERRRVRSSSQHGRRVTYDTQREVAIAVELPVPVPRAVRIGPESILGRVGLTAGGQQLESEEFNRRFRVEADDPNLAVQLLDAALQHELVASFAGRSVELSDQLLVIGGSPDHRDESLTGVIGELPALQLDARRLISRIPDQFWRAVGADRAV